MMLQRSHALRPLACLVLLVLLPDWTHAQAPGPAYDTPETRRLVERMIAAHGGMAPWERADAVRFDHTMFMPGMASRQRPPWFITREVVERRTGRKYLDIPLWPGRMAADERQVWSVNWQFLNPPEQMALVHYYFVFLPWLSQDPSARLEDAGTGTLPPAHDHPYRIVRMTYAGGNDAWSFFIDPETGELGGFGMHPNGKPGALHAIASFIEADGLRVPADWQTFMQDQLIGFHAVTNVSLSEPFDESRMTPPQGARIVSLTR